MIPSKPSILWLDNDRPFVRSYAEALVERGAHVIVVRSAHEAWEQLRGNEFDMIIIDIMIPLMPGDEIHDLSAENTLAGRATGLQFYRTLQAEYEGREIAVLVLTVRIDSEIADAFTDAGLEEEEFATKVALRRVDDFLIRINRLLQHHGRPLLQSQLA